MKLLDKVAHEVGLIRQDISNLILKIPIVDNEIKHRTSGFFGTIELHKQKIDRLESEIIRLQAINKPTELQELDI